MVFIMQKRLLRKEPSNKLLNRDQLMKTSNLNNKLQDH